MSFTFKNSSNAIPIAKIINSSKLIYLLENSTTYENISGKSNDKIKCPHCKKFLSSKTRLKQHLNICDKRNFHKDTKPHMNFPEFEFLLPIPNNTKHNVIFVTGVPGCGKSYYINDYVKMYKELYNNPVYRISRVEYDDTLKKDYKLYLNISIDNELVDDPLTLEQFENSLVIFDDIENSEFPKATQKVYNLMDDMCKNGRHHHIDVIFANQECRMGTKTKAILSTVTEFIIFPMSCSLFQTEQLLKQHVGMSKEQIKACLKINSRWINIHRAFPQYIMHQHGLYMLGKELY